MGLAGIVDDGTFVPTFQDLSRSTYPEWKALVDSNGGVLRQLDLKVMQKSLDRITIYGSDNPTIIVSFPAVRDAYANLVMPDRRFNDELTLDGGFKAVKYTQGDHELPWVVDKYCFHNTLYILDESQLRIFELQPMKWDDETGSIWKQQAAQSGGALQQSGFADAYFAYVKWYGNVGTFRPSAHLVVRDVQENVTV
jgi:hypothetical protein